MEPELTIDRVELGVDPLRLAAMADFYDQRMGLSVTRGAGQVTVRLPGGELQFRASASAPWYHFALLVPGNRFGAAVDWASGRLPIGEVVEFPNWDARAVYFKDPAGNPVELIAHGGYQEAPTTGEFRPSELRGISEMMAITDDLEATSEQLGAAAGLEQWDGDTESGITFVGRRAHTLVLSRTGRRLLSGEVGEPYPFAIELTAAGAARVCLEVANARVARR